MGGGFFLECKKCGYSARIFTGYGMLFVHEYEKVVKEIKQGKHGKELQEFFKNNKNAVVNNDVDLYQCRSCKKLHTQHNMDAYLFESKYETPVGWMLKSIKPEIRAEHICPDCGGKMRRRNPLTIERNILQGKFKCPCCGEIMSPDSIAEVDWD